MRTAVVGTGQEPPRVAFSVGREVGNAVIRNRVRRRLRCALQARVHQLEPGAAYLVRARPGIERAAYPDLENTLRAILGDLSLRKL